MQAKKEPKEELADPSLQKKEDLLPDEPGIMRILDDSDDEEKLVAHSGGLAERRRRSSSSSAPDGTKREHSDDADFLLLHAQIAKYNSERAASRMSFPATSNIN